MGQSSWNNTPVGPSFFLDQMWMKREEPTSGVQIVELKSNGSVKSEERTTRGDSAWSYDSHKNSQSKENVKVNERSRESRRIKLEADVKTKDFFRSLHDEFESDYQNDTFYEDFYSGQSNDIPDVFINHQRNCFTIIDKQFDDDTDSSDEGYENIELVRSEGYMSDQWNRPGQYNGDICTYGPESEMQKQTVWIYSFKNKQFMSENDDGLVNIPSNDTSATSIAESEEVEQKSQNPNVRRAATPYPPMGPINSFVPRIHFPIITPTLPTLTEVTEPKPYPSNRTVTLSKKPMNSWFLSDRATSIREDGPVSKSVVNWMALSPRGERRKFKNVAPKIIPVPDVCKVKINKPGDAICRPKLNPIPVLCNVASQTIEFCNYRANAVFDTSNPRRVIHCEKASVGVSCNFTSGQSKMKDSNESISDVVDNLHDRGDHNRARRRIPEKLKMRFGHPLGDRFIKGSIADLNSGDWVGEDKAIQTTIMTAHDFRRYQEDAPPTLLIRNTSLLKPAEWSEYLPIEHSVPSLQLSTNTDSIEERRSWFSRLCDCIICK